MKKITIVKLFFLIVAVALTSSCNSNQSTEAGSVDTKSADTLSYPYKAIYSSELEPSSKPGNLQKVLTIWKMFETKQIEAMKQYYADTVTYEDASGFRFYGRSDSLLAFAGRDIENLDSLRFDISVWQNLHIKDKNEDWVYIWATERRYPKHGVADTSLMHEQWKIENGKVSYFNQYKAKPSSVSK